MDVLFNKEINQIKIKELIGQQKPKPITFRILEDDVDDFRSQFQGKVRFEIEGGGEVLTSFVRKNEEEFFEFLNDFNQVCTQIHKLCSFIAFTLNRMSKHI